MILHVDMDAFYASIEQRDRPELRGRPVIVGGDPQRRGVVAAASYEVREFGVHSAMPSAVALRLCPHAVFLPCRHTHYGEVSRAIRNILLEYTPLVEPLALDEAFLDVSGSRGLFGPAEEIARCIKQRIAQQLQLVASVGVASNKFLAKLASDLEKPDGLVVVPPGGEKAFLDPLPISRLWGVGRIAQQKFERLRIHTIAQLRATSADLLRRQFGSEADTLLRLAAGIDTRRVVPDQEAKSISHETTFAADIAEPQVLESWLLELTEQVARRLRRYKLRARTVQIKVRFADFRTITRAQSLSSPTNVTEELWRPARQLLEHRLPPGHLPVRLLGLGATNLDRGDQRQGLLFEDEQHQKQRDLDAAADAIRERFGSEALERGHLLKRREESEK